MDKIRENKGVFILLKYDIFFFISATTIAVPMSLLKMMSDKNFNVRLISWNRI